MIMTISLMRTLLVRLARQFRVHLSQTLILTMALLGGIGHAQAAEVSVFASGANGPVSVSAIAEFFDGDHGTVSIYLDNASYSFISSSGDGSASCSYVIDGATLSNGEHTLKAVASDSTSTAVSTTTFTINNPASVSATAPSHPTEPMDVSGTAQFLARKIPGDTTGTIKFQLKPPSSSTYYSNSDWTKNFTTPSVSFNCGEMEGGLYDVATWENGAWELRVSAHAPNGESLYENVTATIKNPISLSADADPHPSGPLNVAGNAAFMERKTAGDTTGSIEIAMSPPNTTHYYSYDELKQSYTTPNVSYSCENMPNGLIDVAKWGNGEWDFRVKAIGPNGATLSANTSTTIQNPVSVTVQTDPNPTGPLDITGNAVFIARKTAGDTTGSIEIDLSPPDSSHYYSYDELKQSYTTPNVSYSCENMPNGLIDVARWVNGEWDFRVKAIGPNSEWLYAHTTATIQNPIDLDSQVDAKPTGPLNVTGTANFIARLTEGESTGSIEITYRLSTSSSWSSATYYNKSYTTPQVDFSCEDMAGGPFDVATWANGDYQIRVRAIGVNSGRLTETKTTTIDNTPKVTASCPRYVSGDFDITGAAVFTENRDEGEGKGTLYINIDSRSTTYAETKSYDKGDPTNFSYAEITGALLNAEALGYGEHVAYIRAKARNGTWSDWLEVPFTTGEPDEDGSGNLIIVPQQ